MYHENKWKPYEDIIHLLKRLQYNHYSIDSVIISLDLTWLCSLDFIHLLKLLQYNHYSIDSVIISFDLTWLCSLVCKIPILLQYIHW